MKKTIITLVALIGMMTSATAQNNVLETAQRTNNYFIAKYSDPRCPLMSRRFVLHRFGHAPFTTKD